MLKQLIYIFVILLPLLCFGQNMPDSDIDAPDVKIYTSIDEIKANPDSVLYIDFSKQKLCSIPNEVFECKNLVYLDLKRNKIEEIPSRIGELQKLRVLNLSKNKIVKLPAEIGLCTQLRSLILNQNAISEICPEIGQLVNLAVLDLWGNEVDRLPTEITRISENLKFLDMRVIYMTHDAQEAIELLLPETTIYFSNGCNCK
ncbi:MAG: hypothetical protein CVU11_09750 [Bacteroidetes bacterium HGW-Bacteroidetes-6]|nr:MAG: hypothetical protein CVU11_09750 [Bacteroidetes bacterium HGW-Bacteroidetes-6]